MLECRKGEPAIVVTGNALQMCLISVCVHVYLYSLCVFFCWLFGMSCFYYPVRLLTCVWDVCLMHWYGKCQQWMFVLSDMAHMVVLRRVCVISHVRDIAMKTVEVIWSAPSIGLTNVGILAHFLIRGTKNFRRCGHINNRESDITMVVPINIIFRCYSTMGSIPSNIMTHYNVVMS